LKILHITPWYAPAWASGGIATASSNLCEKLAELSCNITVFTTLDAGGNKLLGKKSFENVRNGVKVFYFKTGIFSFNLRKAQFSAGLIFNIIKSAKNYDICHIHSSRTIYGFITFLTCKFFNIPYIITPHGTLMEYWMKEIGFPIFKSFISKYIDKYVLKNASSIHYLSELEKESSHDFAYNNNSVVIPNGLLIGFKKNLKILRRYPKLRLLNVGRVHPQKNTFELIKAVYLINNPNIVLDVIGNEEDVSYFQKCKQYITKNKVENVRILGSLPKNKVLRMYKDYDLLCMPSLVEGVSMAIIEAAANGIPALITKRVGNFHEIINDNSGVLVEKNSKDISKKILHIYENPDLLHKMKVNAYNSAHKRYNIENVAKKMKEEYKKILSSK